MLRSSHHSGGAEFYITSIHEATEAEFSKNLVEITLSEQEIESFDEDDQVTIVKCKQEKGKIQTKRKGQQITGTELKSANAYR